ncbi:MAG: hypothetical protein K6D91_06015 [Prevotella sp.]|nr:hypothetical protein [Prevotella sp.]
MFVEDNPDVDFEDKEARYGRLAEERENYRTMKKSGAGLSKALDRNRWLGSMFKDLAENPEKNPLVWLVENGIDVKAALDDPKVMEEVDEKFKNWQQKQVDGENAEKTQNDNIRKSLEALSAVQQKMGISDEQFDRMWEHFWNEVFAPAFNGEVSEETWTAILHAMNYDQDIADAREEAAMQARNEKFANKVKTYEESRVPPSFSAGRPLHTQTQKPKKEKSLADFIKENG